MCAANAVTVSGMTDEADVCRAISDAGRRVA
jgi:hypothetical protein